ncbi:hypothetical protein AAH101_20695, partial [Phocaeicola vulgatus]|uniref:hypothetical protein n=1 Tax=Phocaeicola vulgatus TaxID=821 RepID=UPI0039B653C6
TKISHASQMLLRDICLTLHLLLDSTSGANEDRAQNFVDNSYVRVKNITLGYTFPQKWISKLHISNLRIYANVLNPFTFTSYEGFDPEWADAQVGDGTGGVSSRTYQVGINLKF